MQKKVSVVMATYNGERFLKGQIDSILTQLSTDDELIITDDMSVDGTVAIIQSFGDNRIKLLLSNTNKGVIKNFENGLSQANGDYIFLCDQDDLWASDKVKENLSYLQEYDLVVSDCSLIDESNMQILASYFNRRKSGTGLIKNITANTYLGCCMAFKRSILKTALPFPEKIPMHDIWIGLVAGLFYKPIFINNKLVYYRQHSSNISPTATGFSKASRFEQIMYRVNLIRYIPLAYYRKVFK